MNQMSLNAVLSLPTDLAPPPPIPDQVWFGVWASDVDARNFTSLVWDCWDDATIEQQGDSALRFLYQVGNFF